VCGSALISLNKRWNVLDQGLFILTVLLNAFVMVTKEDDISTAFNPQEANLQSLFLVNLVTKTFTTLFERLSQMVTKQGRLSHD